MAQAMENTSYRLVKSEVCDLTPELAQQFRDLDPSPTERELNAARIRHLKTKAEAGQLVTFHWSVARLGDKRLRMNGQHSSNMLCDLNGLFPKGLKVHVDEYEVPNKPSLGLLFRQFDDRKSNRSPRTWRAHIRACTRSCMRSQGGRPRWLSREPVGTTDTSKVCRHQPVTTNTFASVNPVC